MKLIEAADATSIITTVIGYIEIVQLITQTLSANFSSLLAIVAVGAGVKIVLDIIFKSLYSVTNSR